MLLAMAASESIMNLAPCLCLCLCLSLSNMPHLLIALSTLSARIQCATKRAEYASFIATEPEEEEADPRQDFKKHFPDANVNAFYWISVFNDNNKVD